MNNFCKNSKIILSKICNSNIFFFIFLLLTAVLGLYFLNYDLINIYFSNSFVTGWDGSGHYAIGKYYAENIFPAVWGWVPNWYSGMPFPQFYPPLFYYINALIYSITNFEYVNIFKIFSLFSVVFATIVTSLLYYYRINKSRLQAFFVLILSVFLASFQTVFESTSISISGIINTGLVTQPLAFVFFVLWLIFFLEIEKKEINKYYSGTFLLLTILSNAHVVIVTFLAFVFVFCFKFITKKMWCRSQGEITKFVSTYFLIGFIPLLVSSFWYLTMIYYYDYFTGISLGLTKGTLSVLLKNHYYLMLIIPLSLVLTYKNRNLPIILINSLLAISIIFIALKLRRFFPDLPFHFDRWLGILYFLIPVSIVFCITEIKKIIKNKLIYIIFIFVIATISIYGIVVNNSIGKNYHGIYFDKRHDNIENVLEYFEGKDGLILTESYFSNSKPSDKILNSYLGSQGNNTTYSIIRESALSALSMHPIKNGFSKTLDCWGIKCGLSFNSEYRNLPLHNHLLVAQDFGINYLIIRSFKIKEELNESKLVELEKNFGDYAVYKVNNAANYITKPTRDPIIVFSDLNTRKISSTAFDFISLIENINIKKSRTDFSFAYTQNILIDENNDLKDFNNILIEKYKYKNLEDAKNIMNEIAKTKKIFAIKANDKLFEYLEDISKQNANIIIIKDYPNQCPDNHHDLLISALDKNIPPVLTQENARIIKQSYFPAWKEISGEKTYLSSPTYNLVFTENPIIFFDTPAVVIWAHIISVIGIFISILFLLLKSYKNRRF